MENETELFDTDASASIPDAKANDTIDNKAGTVVAFVEELFSKSETARYTDEQRWLKAYRNYRGIYGADVQFTETEKSQVFVKVTKTKTLAAYGQVTDVLFGNAKFPLTVDPTTLPDGVVESVHFNTDPNAAAGSEDLKKAFAKDPVPLTLFTSEETRLKPGETMVDLMKRVGGMAKKLGPVADKLVEGP